MKILVCLKSVPREVIRPRVSEDGDRVLFDFLGQAMNESDEYALELGARLKFEWKADLLVASVGTLTCQDVLYTGMAKGADEGIRIDADTNDPGIIAELIAGAARLLGVDLVLAGVESWDNLASQVALVAAARLNIPGVYAVTKVDAGENPNSVKITRELGGGVEQVLELALPALLAIQSGSQTLNYVPPNKVILARRRPLRVLSPDSLGLEKGEASKQVRYRVADVRVPEARSRAELIEGTARVVAESILERVRSAAG